MNILGVRSIARLTAGILAFTLAGTSLAQQTPHAFTNATVLPVWQGGEQAGSPAPGIESATIIVKDGKITALGPTSGPGAVAIPNGAVVIDAKGKFIMPGLIDTHSHIGGVGAADQSAPIQPGVRVSDSINVRDSGFRRAVAGGLTSLNIMPGSGHLLSGQTIYVKLRSGRTDKPRSDDAASTPPVHKIEDLAYRNAAGKIMGGIKMANGTNPLRSSPPWPGTRGKAAALVREQFVRAQEYRAKVQSATKADGTLDPDKAPARDLGLEALSKVLSGEWLVQHHTHRADDIMTVLRLKEEFGFRVVLHHTSEAWKVADEIAKAKVPCSIILVDSPGGKLEASELRWDTAAILEKAGVKFGFHTDDWITDSRLFLRMAALGVRTGMSRDGALRALTIEGARMMDIADRAGSLEVGKDADLVILSGDPFSIYTKVEQTWVEGTKVFDRTNERDRLFATGGFGAGRDQEPYFCCFGQ